MLENVNYDGKATLWIIKLQLFFSKIFFSKLIASAFIFYMPIMIVGYILQKICDYKIFSNSIIIALLWIAIAPFLIQDAFEHINLFFCKHKHIFQNLDEWESLYKKEITYIQSSRYLFFGLPWGILGSLVVIFTTFDNAPVSIQLWMGVSFFILFFVSSFGFYGVYVLVTMMQDICSADLKFNPFHPDNFGGISDLGRFSVKIALYFSSCAFVFPLAFEIISKISNGEVSLVVLTYLLFGLVIFALIASFLIPILEIKKFADAQKELILLESRNELDKMIENFKKNQDLNIKQCIEIIMYYNFNYSKLMELKVYPLDFRVLVEFGASFIIPICVVILQVLLV